MTTKIPQEYSAIPENETLQTLNGTDIYLTLTTVVLTSGIVHTGCNLIQLAHPLYFPPLLTLILITINALLAGYYSLTHRYDRFYRQRVWNSVKYALNITFICPLTMIVHIGQTTTNGFHVNQNLFD